MEAMATATISQGADDIPLPTKPCLYEMVGGKVRLHLHPGQERAWDSEKRIVAIISGGRAGKTSFGSWWLHREMRLKGPGDYLMAAPDFPLIDKAAGPEIEHVFTNILELGEMKHNPWQFIVSPKGAHLLWGESPSRPSRIIFGHADAPQSLEAMSAKAAWLDEAGQKKFRLESWEAVRQRVSLDQGRILITSKPYLENWLKFVIHDPYHLARGNHPEIDVINFDSTENPAFPREELERARRELPHWKFAMQYLGIFSRPAGLIYSSFDASRHKIPRFEIDPSWPRFIGLDFGGVNTAATFFAEERSANKPTGRYFIYREYRAGERSAAEHVYHLMKGDDKNTREPRVPTCAGGSKSEGQWRREFAAGGTVRGVYVPGLPIHAPPMVKGKEESIVEVGINRVFKAFSLDQLYIFDDLAGLLDELGSYGRELDEMGEPTAKIADKESFHLLDSVRYAVQFLNTDRPKATLQGSGSVVAKKGLVI